MSFLDSRVRAPRWHLIVSGASAPVRDELPDGILQPANQLAYGQGDTFLLTHQDGSYMKHRITISVWTDANFD